jgi:hypothetical protein
MRPKWVQAAYYQQFVARKQHVTERGHAWAAVYEEILVPQASKFLKRSALSLYGQEELGKRDYKYSLGH